ncbi:MAG TPA: glycosyltransferase family 1 protein [Sulfurospirillum arcachonense]|nr:glycosyltransferase family 1 protein [Sulfurospirillum arcachonense]
MKRIVLVSNTSWSMLKFRLGVMKSLVEKGYDVIIIAPRDKHSDEFKELGCHYIELAMDNKGSNIFKDLRMVYKLQKAYKKLDPDLIFHYTIKPNIYGTFAAFLAKKRSIAVITGLGYTFIHDTVTAKIAKYLYKVSLKHSEKVWFINVEDKNKFLLAELVAEEKMELLPSEGINVDTFTPITVKREDNIFRFILIARLLWDKGVGEYVKAAKVLAKKYDNVECQLLGFIDAQNPKAISKEQVDDWVQKGYVNYLGPTDDVKPFIAKADCIVLPSYREGVSMILMESAAMQKPLIATNVPGCRDLINSSVSGYTCQMQDYQDLVAKMEKMLHLSEKQRQKMGKEGRKLMVEEYNENLVIEKYLQVIRKLTWDERVNKFVLKKKVEN